MSEKEVSRLIILGAGASVDCGFYPTGTQLMKIAKEIIDFDRGADKSDLKFLRKMIESHPTSIDAYIAGISNTGEQYRIKSLIASTIITSTILSSTRQEIFDKNWYFSVWQLIEENLRKFETGDDKIAALKKLTHIRIITFNYDVSLEIFLWQRVKANFAEYKKAKESFEIITTEMIHHVYGQIATWEEIIAISDGGLVETLGSIFLAYRESLASIPENSMRNISDLLVSVSEMKSKFLCAIYNIMVSNLDGNFVNRINVIADKDRIGVSKELTEIVSEDVNWDMVYILGYGFDSINNQRINLKKINWQKGCFVTNYGGNKKIERVIYEELGREIFYPEYLVDHANKTSADHPDYVNPNKDLEYRIPLISSSEATVKKALDDEFSLIEKIDKPLTIRTDRNLWLALKNRNL